MRAASGPTFYDCSHCEKVPMMKLMQGHDGPPQIHRANVLTGETFVRCPVRTLQLAADADPALFSEVENVRLGLFPAYRDHGVLPIAGGVLDQPAKMMGYLQLFANVAEIAERKFAELRGSAGDNDEEE